ncbi:hypothetical protein [Leptolyngbya sp. GGD]|uniref:hypothetical protein n=1 Tax=Leptolyngbya sp. GGD TaxID=2997907 RepID=UPI00227BA935|nr:hypothetical protein [Leptolyngbya sp. GGD]MCY6494258.1 hypothetical protein [Leptolyngbya sp. GGD]
MKSYNSSENAYNPSEKLLALAAKLEPLKEKCIQVGSDYIRKVQTNVAAKNWSAVIVLVAVPTVGVCVGLKTVEYTVGGVVSFVQDLGGPSRGDLKQHLQSQLPDYWEITSIEIKEKQNTGTKVDPYIFQRFRAKARLKTDTFFEASKIDGLPAKKQNSVVFISAVERKGKEVELFGFSTSKLVAEKWQSEFRFDVNPTGNYGQPRHYFGARNIVRNSKEEEEFAAAIKKQVEEERATLLSAIKSGAWLSGDWTDPSGEFNPSGKNTQEMQIRFTSFDEGSGNLTGEVKFGSSVKRFEGALTDDKIQFTTVAVLDGRDPFGLGTEYTFAFDANNTMRGEWKHLTQLNIPLAGLLPNQGYVTRKGSASFRLQ